MLGPTCDHWSSAPYRLAGETAGHHAGQGSVRHDKMQAIRYILSGKCNILLVQIKLK